MGTALVTLAAAPPSADCTLDTMLLAGSCAFAESSLPSERGSNREAETEGSADRFIGVAASGAGEPNEGAGEP